MKIVDRLKRERGIGDELMKRGMYPDSGRAAARVHRAIAEKENIAIFGDYDCDGVTSVAQLVRFFRRRGVEPHVRLPHRILEGYGLTTGVIDECAAKNITLLITADTGITAISEIERAREKGMDVIVLDHHHMKEELPPAFAILHPMLSPGYPEPHPCAAGVVFQFVEILEGKPWEDRETDFALAAIGTIGDLVPLRGWNRRIVQAGLRALHGLKAGSLAILAEHVRTNDDPLTSRDIAFRIAPRLNAAGRMDDPMIALQALLGDETALRSLHVLNEERQQTTAILLEEVLVTMEQKQSLPFLCCIAEHFPPGIVGLLAGKLTEKFGKPSLVGNIRDGICRASLRSIPGYNVMEGLTFAGSSLHTFGGHAQAAGCTFAVDGFDVLEQALCGHLSTCVSVEDLRPTMALDAVLSTNAITLGFCEALKELEPYGQGNLEPRFLLKNITLDRPGRVGADQSHLRARIGGVTAIGFGLGSLAETMPERVDIACRVGINKWNERVMPQIMVEDIRQAKEQASLVK